jgi:hypothetical protein
MLAGERLPSVHILDILLPLALQHLFSPLVKFYGITELWNQSICTFHCELGGEGKILPLSLSFLLPSPSFFLHVNLFLFTARDSEYLNTRDNGKLKSEEMEISSSIRDTLQELLKWDIELHRIAKRRFLERALKCGCLDVQKRKEMKEGGEEELLRELVREDWTGWKKTKRSVWLVALVMLSLSYWLLRNRKTMNTTG